MRKIVRPLKSDDINIIPKIKTTNRDWDFIAEQLKRWSLQPESFILEEFYTNLDIPEKTFYDNLEKSETLNEAHSYALTRLGINREKLAIKRGENVNSTNSFILPHYLKRWSKQIEWRAELKAKDEAKNEGTKFIVLEKFEDPTKK